MEWRGAAIRPREDFRAIIGGPQHDGVVGDAEVVELLEKLTNHTVHLDHAVGFKTEPRLACLISDSRTKRESTVADSMNAIFWFAALSGVIFIALAYYPF
jgi:hypothetical protein